jgi:hypothetical protein
MKLNKNAVRSTCFAAQPLLLVFSVAKPFLTATPIFRLKIWLVRWPDMDVWTRRRLYMDVTLSRSDIEARFLAGLKNWLEQGTFWLLYRP